MRLKKHYSTSLLLILLSWAVALSASSSCLLNPSPQRLVNQEISGVESDEQGNSKEESKAELHELFSVKIVNNVASFQLGEATLQDFTALVPLHIPQVDKPIGTKVLKALPLFYSIVFRHYTAPNAP